MLRQWIFIGCIAIWSMTSLCTANAADPDLVGWWKLDESFGNVATDSSLYGNHGTLYNNPAWVQGVIDGGLSFDGQNDYVNCGSNSVLNIQSEITIAAWIKLGVTGRDHKILSNQSYFGGYKLAVYSNNKVELAIRTPQSQIILNRNVTGGTTLQRDTWYHVAAVFSAQHQYIRTYVNGVLDREMQTNNAVMGSSTSALWLGRDVFYQTYYANVALDDVRVYRRILSDIEIQGLALQGSDNDDCASAMPISEVSLLEFDTTEATHDGQGQCMSSPNIWFCYTALCTGLVTVSLQGSHYDTMLAVYKGCGCTSGQSFLIGCNDDFYGLQSQLVFNAVAGDQYLIEVGGYANRTGQGVMTITCEGGAPGEFDLGDAPDSLNDLFVPMTAYTLGTKTIQAYFPTTFLGNGGTEPQGPIHLDPLGVAYLGQKVSLENEAYKGPDEDTDNNIDPAGDIADMDGFDDGVDFPIHMPHCDWATMDYHVNVIDPNHDLWVNVWCDWNRDGDWDDDYNTDPNLESDGRPVSEWAVQNQFLFGLSAGIHKITSPAFLSWHPVKGPEQMWMRITLSEKPWKPDDTAKELGLGGSGPRAGYDFGETEDYLFTPDTSCSACDDLNGDGFVDLDDLWILLDDWFNNCLVKL